MNAEDCVQRLNGAFRIARTDLTELTARSLEWLSNRYRDLRQEQEYYDEHCTSNLTFSQRSSDIGLFELARLKLAASIKAKAPEDDEIMKLLEFSDDEYNALNKLERFARLDFITEEEIASSIYNKKGVIYDIVKRWYDEQMEEYEKLLNVLDEERKREALAAALREVYRGRFEKIRSGILKYMEMDLGAPRILFKDYEGALRKLHQAEEERREVEAWVRGVAAAEQRSELERGLEELRAEREKLLSNLDEFELIGGGREAPLRIEDLSAMGEAMNRRIEELISTVRNRLSSLERSRAQLEARMKELSRMSEAEGGEARMALEAELHRMRETDEAILREMDEYRTIISRLELEGRALRGRLRDALQGRMEGKLTTREEARMMEINFIERFERKIRGELPRSFLDPIRKEQILVNKPAELLRAEFDEASTLKEAYHIPAEELALFPRNMRVSYTITKRRWLKDEPKVIIEAAFIAHLDSYAKLSYDTKAINLSDFLIFLDKAIERAKLGQAFYVIGIGSPTGFDDALKKYLWSEEYGKGFVANHVSLCLVDLISDQVIYNEADRGIGAYIDLFKLELEDEKLLRVRRYLEEQKWYHRHLSLHKVASETGVNSIHVKRVFYQLESEGMGRVLKVDGDLVFSFTGEGP